MVNWRDEVTLVAERLEAGETLQSVGESYGVSKQRMYQVLTKFGIPTPCRKRKNFLVNKEPKYYWLNKMLCIKGFNPEDRQLLLDTLELPDYCPALGIRMNYEGLDTHVDNSPSIDRIDNSKGYEIGNIQIISRRANRLKSDSNAAELELIVRFLNHLHSG